MAGEIGKGNEKLVEGLESQGLLKTPGIIEAFRKTPRHLFVREGEVKFAYSDLPLPIGYGQTISAPHMVAIMTELLEPAKSDRVLEIGSGSGWQAAILSKLVKEVWTIEFDPYLAEFARANLKKLGIRNVKVMRGDGWLGHPQKAPYDKVIATCAVPGISPHWIKQLKEGGIMMAPVGGPWLQELVLARKIRGKLRTENHGGCVFVPLRR